MTMIPSPDIRERSYPRMSGAATVTIEGVLLRHGPFAIGHTDLTVETDEWGDPISMSFCSSEVPAGERTLTLVYRRDMHPDDRRLWDAMLTETGDRLADAIDDARRDT